MRLNNTTEIYQQKSHNYQEGVAFSSVSFKVVVGFLFVKKVKKYYGKD